MTEPEPPSQTAPGIRRLPGVVLAGGGGRRLGGVDKALVELAGRPLIAHVIDRLRAQCGPLAINANGDAGRFEAFGLCVIPDAIAPPVGPLGGVLAALEWARKNDPDAPCVLIASCDTPFLPVELCDSLYAAQFREEADISCAASSDRLHPLCALWSTALVEPLREAASEADVRQAHAFMLSRRTAFVDFSGAEMDPFFNINEPADLARAERWLKTE